ncbi:MAG: M1 family metallopeptidase [Bacteroidota bacterium]
MSTLKRRLNCIVILFLAFALNGQEYFQQRVDYTIEVELDDEKHFLHGKERFVYTNNSPQLLNEIFVHLWPNAYKDNSTALNKQKLKGNDFDFHFSDLDDRGFVDSLSFSQDGVDIEYELTQDPDIIKLILKKPILSSESSVIETPFRVKIPNGRFSRFGHTGQAYYITQWYPKPAVFDAEGWHAMPYLDQGEFYSEFGSFDVKITLPSNYIVGATGDLQNEDEIEFLKQRSANDMEIDFGPEFENPDTPSSSETKTLHYIQDQVHDFAWFADKQFYVHHDKVELPYSKDSVDVWAMFTRANGEVWDKIAIEALRDGVYYYSLWNGDYPYKHCTAIDGTISAGGGMEYPNITIIGNSADESDLERVIVHEVGHNWFYGILASNERAFPWMDEGINSYYEHRYFEEKYPDQNITVNFGIPLPLGDKKMSDLAYFLGQSRNSEQAIQAPSEEYSSTNYGTIVYEKASFAMHYLAAYLGQEEFDLCMKKYFEEWKFKHPGPQDIWAVFEQNASKDVSWFFEKMLHFTSPIDHRVCGRSKDSPRDVVVRNMGRYPSPIPVSTYKKGELIETKWTEAFEGKDTLRFESDDFDEIRIDASFDALQANRKNDRWKESRLFKNWETIRLSFMPFLRERRNSKLGVFLPLLGRNSNDGLMLGGNISNIEALKKKWEFDFTPLYAFRSDNLTGYGRINANLRTDWGPLKFTEVFSKVSSFSFKNSETEKFKYSKWTAGFEMEFRPKVLKKNNVYTFKYEFFQIENAYDIDEIRVADNGEFFEYSFDQSNARSYHDLLFTYQDRNTLLQNRSKLNFRIAEDHQRISIDHLSRLYYKENRAVDFRIFAASLSGQVQRSSERLFLTGLNSQLTSNVQIRDFVDDTFRSGGQDYLYEDVLLSRTDSVGLWSNQLFMGQGAFKVPIIGQSSDWMLSSNLDIDLPLPVNIGIFSSWGWVPEVRSVSGRFIEETAFYQEYGLKWTLLRDYFTIYFPLLFDNDGDGEMDQSEFGIGKSISFNLNLKQMSPRELRELIPY